MTINRNRRYVIFFKILFTHLVPDRSLTTNGILQRSLVNPCDVLLPRSQEADRHLMHKLRRVDEVPIPSRQRRTPTRAFKPAQINPASAASLGAGQSASKLSHQVLTAFGSGEIRGAENIMGTILTRIVGCKYFFSPMLIMTSPHPEELVRLLIMA